MLQGPRNTAISSADVSYLRTGAETGQPYRALRTAPKQKPLSSPYRSPCITQLVEGGVPKIRSSCSTASRLLQYRTSRFKVRRYKLHVIAKAETLNTKQTKP